MASLKWFKKVEAAQAQAAADAKARGPLERFDFGSLTSSSWTRQKLARFLFRWVFPLLLAIARAVWPVVRFGRFVIVTRHADVRAILRDEGRVFPVVYGPEMKELGGGVQGVLGMDGGDHQELRSQIWRQLGDDALLKADLERIRDWARANTNALLDAGAGEIDVCQDLFTRTATEVCCRYLGIEPHDPDAFGRWGIAVSMMLFGDPTGDANVRKQATIAAAHLRALIDDGIDRVCNNLRQHPFDAKAPEEQVQIREKAPLIYRLIAIEKMDPRQVRATIMGLATGFVPTNTLAAGNILEELLARPRDVGRVRAAAAALAEARNAGDKAAEAVQLGVLETLLLDAARRNPALSPGIWRHCPLGGKIPRTGRKSVEIAAESVILVSILSALRDSRMLREVGDDPRRAAALVFGYGPHECMGAQMALAQITEMFAALFARPGLALAPGKAGRMWRAGPFPVECHMRYHCENAARALIVIALPVRKGVDRDDVEVALDGLGNPLNEDFAKQLDATNCISFASMHVIEKEEGSRESILLVELNGDGDEQRLLEEFAAAGESLLGPVLAFCTPDGAEPASTGAMAALLTSGVHRLHRKPWGPTGVHYDGVAELSTTDIDRQHRLALRARAEVERYLRSSNRLRRGARAMHLLLHVRRHLKGDWFYELRTANRAARATLDSALPYAIVRPGRKRLRMADWQPPKSMFHPLVPMLRAPDSRAFVLGFMITWLATGISLLLWLRPEIWPRAMAALSDARTSVDGVLSNFADALWSGGVDERLAGAAARLWEIVAALPAWFWSSFKAIAAHGWDIATVVIGGFVASLTLLAALVMGFAVALRLREMRDKSDDSPADYAHVHAITEKENAEGFEQNHIIAVMPLKRGFVRRLSFAFAMWAIKQAVTYWFRPGFVVTMGTIHKARWFRVRGTNQFVFFSNYDGSWESYLEDFITRAHEGQSAAWSHGVGFPPTSFLIFEGAKDGDRFKRWVRRQQRVSRVWYSRFPGLTTKQIRLNAMIEDGLARATSDTDARRWLANFGSAQREVSELEAQEVQGILFTGFAKQRFASTLLLRLPDDPLQLRGWVDCLLNLPDDPGEGNMPVGRLCFGEIPGDGPAIILGFTAAGLAKAGLSLGAGMDELPAAFRMGMSGRGRVLGDPDASTWRWSDDADRDNGADAVLVIYHDETPEAFEREDRSHRIVERHWQLFEAMGGHVVHAIPCEPVRINGEWSLEHEHFGFRDGISQPVIRGSRRAQHVVPERDIVAPGEFLLGYRNDQGYVSPSITLGAELDPTNNLPTLAENSPNRFPYFGNRNSCPELRDFGRNGSFLVLRQFDQDVEGFEEALTAKAKELDEAYPLLSELIGREVNADWLAAKIIGRWKNGASLIADPHGVASKVARAAPDNDFTYGTDDPRGLACPLGSHIRRTNPRDSFEPGDGEEQQITNRHRILRRGRAYAYAADGDGKERKGLLFAGLCSDLERQFEFIQSTWINARTFHGLTDEADPLMGNPLARGGHFQPRPRSTDGQAARFTIPTAVGPVMVNGLSSHVSMRGGGYFLLPSRSAIQHLLDRLKTSRAAAP